MNFQEIVIDGAPTGIDSSPNLYFKKESPES